MIAKPCACLSIEQIIQRHAERQRALTVRANVIHFERAVRAEHGEPVNDIRAGQQRLEDVFLRLTGNTR